MTRSEAWDEARIRLLVMAVDTAVQKVETNLQHRLDELRIDAEVEVVSLEHADEETLFTHSGDAAFVFLPLRLEGMRMLHPTGGSVEDLLKALPVVAMVAASGDVQLRAEDEEAEAPGPSGPEAGDAPLRGRGQSTEVR